MKNGRVADESDHVMGQYASSREQVVAYNQGSIVHLETSGVMVLDLKHPLRLAKELKPRKHMLEEMGAAYTASAVFTSART